MEIEFREEVIDRLARIETRLDAIEKRLDKPNPNGKKGWEQALVETIRVLIAALLAALGLRVVQS